MGGDRHDCAVPVGYEDVVRYPDGDELSVHRIPREGAGEYPGLLLREICPLQIGLLPRPVHVGFDVGLSVRRGYLLHEAVFRGEHHVGRSEEGVRPRGVHPDHVLPPFHGEIDVGPFALPDPVPLHGLDGFRPFERIETFEETISVFGDPQDPLPERAFLHRVVPPFGPRSFRRGEDLLVGEDGPELLAVPDRDFVHIGESLLVELEEDPLGPSVVFCGVGGHFAVPIVREPEGFDLLSEPIDVRFGGGAGMGAGLYGVILGRQTEAVEPHGMEHRVPVHPEIPAVDIGGGVSFGMTDVEPRGRRVGEHVEDVPPLLLRDGRIFDRLEGPVLLPISLPFFFYLVCRVCAHARILMMGVSRVNGRVVSLTMVMVLG